MKREVFIHEPTELRTLDLIRSSLPRFLTGKRLIHTFSVEKEALNLAGLLFPVLGIDSKYLTDISAAGLLHDITKQFSADEQKCICKKYGIETGISSDGSAVLHSRTGAFIAKEHFGINDIVFNSIYCHTTGKENMNIFEKIIFIADYIEETRTHPECVKAREFFYSNANSSDNLLKTLDMTIIMSLDSTLSYLECIGSETDSETIKARDFLLAEYALQRSVQE